MKPLDIINMPLLGHSLIEASAGTGKTYTISHLFLRLLIMPQQGLHDRPLNIDEILVVTFTKAATEELRDRVRKNLLAALEYLHSGQSEDAILVELLDKTCKHNVNSDSKKQVVLRLKQAVFSLDEAAIFTIHSFCQRVLNDYSFYTGLSVEQSLVQDNTEILQSLAQELWREEFYSLPKKQAQLVRGLWANPNALQRHYANYLCDDAVFVNADINDLFQQFSNQFTALSIEWPKHQQAILAEFAKGKVNGAYNKGHIKTKSAALDDFICDESCAFDALEANNIQAMRQSIMNEKNSSSDNKVAHPVFDLLDELHDLKQQIIDCTFNQIHQRYREKLASLQQEQAILFFDDLIDRVHRILSAENAESETLAAILRQRFPAALIDEFQDTDVKQYGIFSRIYQQGLANCLLMIGDPKQAIYGFRNADIHTYFKAKSAVDESQQYTLDTNWRSSPALVTSVNQLFMQSNNPFIENNFSEFIALKSPPAFKGHKGLALDGDDYALSVLSLDEEGGVDAIRDQAMRQTALFIQSSLTQQRLINNTIIQPKDIAILVRTAAHGQVAQDILAEYGIKSVFLSKESILQSNEVTGLLRLLKAVLEPFNSEYIFTALSLDFVAFNAEKIQQLKDDNAAFYVQQRHFIDALELWKNKGFVAMWQFISHSYGIDTNLLANTYGERQFTNLQQLIEVFQQRTQRFAKPMQQYLHFKQWLVLAGNDEQKKRLESESNLVQIVTMHSSKGLEYGVVCCPFLSTGEAAIKGKTHRVFDAKKNAKALHWQINEQHKAQLAQEQFAESIRVLYVALTRAKYHLNICWGPVKGADKSGLWHLLYGQSETLKSMDMNDFWQPIDNLANTVRDPDIIPMNAASTQPQQSLQANKVFSRQLQQRYVARSYSALLHTHSKHNDKGDEKDWDELGAKVLAAPIVNDVPEFEETIFHFPKGADAGNFMHMLLENIGFNDAPDIIAVEANLQLERFGFDANLWAKPMAAAMHEILHVDLSSVVNTETNDAYCLADIPEPSLLKEMGFNLTAKNTEGSVFAALLSRYRGGRAVERFSDVGGMFTGFIDLLFERDGKYYVLDYKSNFLGFTADDYSHEAMQEAIEDHCYDLQYLIYVAALQRFLKTRIRDYNYQQHIGGVYYLFLRGMKKGETTGIYFARPPQKIIDEIERLFLPATLSTAELAS